MLCICDVCVCVCVCVHLLNVQEPGASLNIICLCNEEVTFLKEATIFQSVELHCSQGLFPSFCLQHRTVGSRGVVPSVL